MRRKRCQDDNDWLYAGVGQKMIEWLKVKATIRLSADLCDIAEPKLADWYRPLLWRHSLEPARLRSRSDLSAIGLGQRVSIMKVKLATAFLCLFLTSSAFGEQVVIRGKCVGVHNGDSITLLTPARVQLKIRVAFIDAPNLGQPFGYRAK